MEKRPFNTRFWIWISIFNFCVVALAGITMRYKINFPLPFVNQKHVLYAHSNFAFAGWVTVVLMVLMVNYLLKENVITNYRKYNWILGAACFTAYGLFISFIYQSYGYFSISFSTLSVLVSYFFIFFFWRDLKKISDPSFAPRWFKAGLTLWIISSFGEISLAYLMVNFSKVQDYYFAALYFFLHFQYNGWFLFVCFGLLFSYLYKKGFLLPGGTNKKLFIVMAATVVPTYFLSILWLKLPHYLHVIADISGILQLVVLFYFIKLFQQIKKNNPKRFTKTTRYLWIMASIAFMIKIVLQTLSIIPFLSHFAFGFRPIVIGYLHLSFLGIISFFIIGFIDQLLSEANRHISRMGAFLFVTGVLVQEIVLMFQGLEAIEFEPLPYANLILFYAAVVIGAGLIWILARLNQENKSRI